MSRLRELRASAGMLQSGCTITPHLTVRSPVFMIPRWGRLPERCRRVHPTRQKLPEPENPIAWNRYAYVYNSPLNYTDPSGHSALGLALGALAVVDAVWDGVDFLGYARDCFGDNSSLACSMVAGAGLMTAIPGDGLGDNAARREVKEAALDLVAESADSGVFKFVDPRTLRWTQNSAGAKGRAAKWRRVFSAQGWDPAYPIDVVETVDGLVSVDHTRANVAIELGIDKIPVRVHQPSDLLPPSMFPPALKKPRFRYPNGDVATTWWEAIASRAARQKPPLPPTGTTVRPKLP